MKLFFPEITFSAAHYIRGHPTCGGIHGHTYFVRNLVIDVVDVKLDSVGISVDFGVIKDYFKREWDHKFIVPMDDLVEIRTLIRTIVILDNLKTVMYTTAEGMAVVMQWGLHELLGLNSDQIHFELWEGPNQAVVI